MEEKTCEVCRRTKVKTTDYFCVCYICQFIYEKKQQMSLEYYKFVTYKNRLPELTPHEKEDYEEMKKRFII